MAASIVKSVGLTYMKLMNTHPLPMQAVQSGILMGTGDFIAQKCVEGKAIKDIDWRRTSNYFLIGFIFVGPVVSRWYRLIENFFGKNGIKTTLKKIAADQLLFAPVLIPTLISTVSLTEGKSFPEIQTKLENDYKDVLMTNYKIWPFVQVINFSIVPLNYRIIFVQVIALGWNTYLSSKISSTSNEGF